MKICWTSPLMSQSVDEFSFVFPTTITYHVKFLILEHLRTDASRGNCYLIIIDGMKEKKRPAGWRGRAHGSYSIRRPTTATMRHMLIIASLQAAKLCLS